MVAVVELAKIAPWADKLLKEVVMVVVVPVGPDYWPVLVPGSHSCQANLIFALAYLAPPGHSDYFVIANSYYSSDLPFTSLQMLFRQRFFHVQHA